MAGLTLRELVDWHASMALGAPNDIAKDQHAAAVHLLKNVSVLVDAARLAVPEMKFPAENAWTWDLDVKVIEGLESALSEVPV